MAREQSIEQIPVLLEGEAHPLDFEFWDATGEPATPNQIYYRVISPVDNTVIRDDTQVPNPAPVVTIMLDVPDTGIVDATKHKEKRRVIAVAEYASGEKTVETYDFHVRNVKTLTA